MQRGLTQKSDLANMKKVLSKKENRPEQFSFFEIFETLESKNKYSNLINFYSCLPIFSYSKQKEELALERVNFFNGEFLKVIIDAAIIIDENTSQRIPTFLGEREEIIQDVLFKLASKPEKLQLYDKLAGFNFSLREIRKELKKINHSYSHNEIKESLEILKKTQITLKKDSEKKARHIFSPIEDLILISKEEYQESKGEEATCFLRFNSYVTEAILNGSYRLFDYQKSMQLSCFARYLFKRLSSCYKQANQNDKYHLSLNTIFKESSFEKWTDATKNRQRIKKALKELKENNIISSFEENQKKEGKKVVDVVYSLTPTREFSSEVKQINWLEADKKHKRGLK